MKVTALILAGKRSGVLDPLAANAGVAQKCVVPVGGKPLIEHVVTALAACDRVAEIRIVSHEPDEIEAIALVKQLKDEGRLVFRPGAFNLVDSVFSGAEGAEFPIMITTADNVLVTPEGYAEFIDKALAAKAGAAAALARKEDVQAADPDGQKRFYEFRDGGFSNCNTYWIGSPEALSAAEIFRNGGQFVKFPRRIAKAFGIMNLIRFRLGWGAIDPLFAKLSRRFGFKLSAIIMSKGEYAIDVDNQRTYDVTEKMLAARAATAAAASAAAGA
ncbi:NTP transferase domain-containing protein [Allopontixanthobacter confluentis]|uniref:NTP transferase domain-containing protein n=1 Tax=Allopontixanthobacter confluentis TaxID=1849021 RepID=UPI002FCDA6E4